MINVEHFVSVKDKDYSKLMEHIQFVEEFEDERGMRVRIAATKFLAFSIVVEFIRQIKNKMSEDAFQEEILASLEAKKTELKNKVIAEIDMVLLGIPHIPQMPVVQNPINEPRLKDTALERGVEELRRSLVYNKYVSLLAIVKKYDKIKL